MMRSLKTDFRTCELCADARQQVNYAPVAKVKQLSLYMVVPSSSMLPFQHDWLQPFEQPRLLHSHNKLRLQLQLCADARRCAMGNPRPVVISTRMGEYNVVPFISFLST